MLLWITMCCCEGMPTHLEFLLAWLGDPLAFDVRLWGVVTLEGVRLVLLVLLRGRAGDVFNKRSEFDITLRNDFGDINNVVVGLLMKSDVCSDINPSSMRLLVQSTRLDVASTWLLLRLLFGNWFVVAVELEEPDLRRVRGDKLTGDRGGDNGIKDSSPFDKLLLCKELITLFSRSEWESCVAAPSCNPGDEMNEFSSWLW